MIIDYIVMPKKCGLIRNLFSISNSFDKFIILKCIDFDKVYLILKKSYY